MMKPLTPLWFAELISLIIIVIIAYVTMSALEAPDWAIVGVVVSAYASAVFR